MQIIYCDKCGLRISETDLASGAAIQDPASQRAFCPNCAPASRPTKVFARPPTREATALPRSTPAQGTRTMPGRPAQKASSNNSLIFVGIGAGVIGLVLIALSLRGKKESPDRDAASAVPAATEFKPAETAAIADKKPGDAAASLKTSSPATPAPPAQADIGVDDIRERFAQRKWADLKAETERQGINALMQRQKVGDFASTYASTAAGKEAAEYFKNMKASVPPPPGATLFAGYKRDFKAATPAPGWRYMWNKGGDIGRSSHYAPLVWNEKKNSYTSEAAKYPVGMPPAWVRLSDEGGHPGGGSNQGAGADRFAIAAYTLKPGESGKTAITGTIRRPAGNGKIELRLYVNDTLKGSILVSSANVDFSSDLGAVKEGDSIFVAVGPEHDDSSDSFTMDFSVYPIP